jgi:hypothetical protein
VEQRGPRALQSERTAVARLAEHAWDWFHINAVHLDTDGNLLIDARDTWTTYKVNRTIQRSNMDTR